MGTSIATNISALHAQENFRTNGEFQADVIQRLTSGLRISRAADDPTGLALANRFRSDAADLSQGIRNLNDAIGRLQIIDGGIGNISQILDRLKTLATQSSSDAFVGDRNTVNSEFQTLLGEIDRQAESIGLNTFGKFAQAMTVFVGGGGSSADTKVDIDLSSSAVDTRGLGLGGSKAMQAVAGSADIGPLSIDHTVTQILNDSTNTGAIPSGYTDLYMAGPGFSDGSQIKVAVNLQGVSTLDGLVAAVNSAIGVAASGTTPAAIAFQKAAIVASSYNSQQLAFTSANTPFQVEAGDRMANALMGNLTGATGVDPATTLGGVATPAADSLLPGDVTVRINGGGMAAPVDLKVLSTGQTTAWAIDDLTSQIAANAQLTAAGITVSGAAGGSLTFTDARGEIFSVEAVGDTTNALGLGSYVASGTGVDYTSIQGAVYQPDVATGIAHLEFSIGGGPAIAIPDIDLAGGDAIGGFFSRSGADLQKTLNDAFAANPVLQSAGLVASFNGAGLTISSNNGTDFRLNPGGSSALADIGFGTGGAASALPLVVPAAQNNTIDSRGANAVSSVSFAGLTNGDDGQTITVSADGPNSGLQTATIQLGNSAQGRAGRSIDETIAAINAQLQQSGATLQQIVAVKENVGGAEQIGFLSSVPSYHVLVSNSAGASGLNGGAAISEDSYAMAPLVNVSVSTRDSALLSLTAITGAVGALGAAQAVAGKADNQLNYAITLSQSQVTNFTSAESSIRDTDVAADAANLTKAQIQAQATVAAMAQANTLAQSVLALLKG